MQYSLYQLLFDKAFFHFLGVTTIEFKSIFALDDHLVAATGQSGIRCQTGILIQLIQIGIALADAHGDGGADTGAAFDFPDSANHYKPVPVLREYCSGLHAD